MIHEIIFFGLPLNSELYECFLSLSFDLLSAPRAFLPSHFWIKQHLLSFFKKWILLLPRRSCKFWEMGKTFRICWSLKTTENSFFSENQAWQKVLITSALVWPKRKILANALTMSQFLIKSASAAATLESESSQMGRSANSTKTNYQLSKMMNCATLTTTPLTQLLEFTTVLELTASSSKCWHLSNENLMIY